MTSLNRSPASSLPILIVDDEPAVLALLQDTLEGEGFAVLTAVNGEDALSLIQQTPVALVLTDLMMPLVSGSELARHLHTNPQTAAIPVLVMSVALPVSSDGLFAATIHKPFSLSEIVATVRRLYRA